MNYTLNKYVHMYENVWCHLCFKIWRYILIWSKSLSCIGHSLHILFQIYDYFRNVFKYALALICGFQQCHIWTSVESEEPVQPPFKLSYSKWCSVSSLTLIEYSSDPQRLWLASIYAQAGLRPCWPHIPHCWKSNVALISYWDKMLIQYMLAIFSSNPT